MQPLIDAGLEPEEIEHLLVGLAFDTIVGQARPSPAALREVVADRPREVQAAWSQTLVRMFQLEP